jgi:RNA polymerase sigma-70 factor (sigma-E family)
MNGDGAEAALRQVFTESFAPFCRTAYLLVGDRLDAEDIVMEAFAATHRSLDRVRDTGKLTSFVRTAVINLARNRLRRRDVERRGAATLRRTASLEAAAVEPVDDDVVAAIRALPDRQRAAVVLRYFDDLDERTIAETLGCSVGTVKSQLSKAKVSIGLRLAPREEVR